MEYPPNEAIQQPAAQPQDAPAPEPATEAVPPVSPPAPPSALDWKRGLRRQANLSGLMLILLVVLSNAVGYLGLYLLKTFGGGLDDGVYHTLLQVISYSSMYLVVVPILLAIFNRHSNHRLRDLFVRPQIGGKSLLKWVVIGFGCTYAVNYVFNIFFTLIKSFGIEMHTPDMTSSGGWINGVITVFFFAVAAPLCEELLFRGSLLGRLRNYGGWFASIMVGILFGMTHMNYQQIFFAAALGMIAGYITLRAQSIWPAILMHFSINIVGAVQSVLLGNFDLTSFVSGQIDREALVRNILPMLAVLLLAMLCMGLAVTGVVLLCVEASKRREQFRLENPCTLLSGGEKAVTFLTAPGIFVFLLLAVVMTAFNAAG